jgi:hypothetical protein
MSIDVHSLSSHAHAHTCEDAHANMHTHMNTHTLDRFFFSSVTLSTSQFK